MKKSGDGEGQLEEGGERAEVAPGDGGPRKRDSVRLEKERPVTVMDEGKAEGDGEEIEECVVPGEADQEHEGEESEGSGEADFGLGKEKGEREEEFDGKGEKGGEVEKRVGELLNEPGERVGDGLGKEVVGHGGEIGPGGVAAEDFDDARTEHKTEDEEGEGEADEEGWSVGAGWAGAEPGFFEKDNEKADFEEESVPLEGEEVLTDVHEGEPAEPRQDGADWAKKSGEK